MAAPSVTTRVTPTGTKLGRGAVCYITFANNPDLNVWEKSLTPSGLKCDERKDSSTFHNQRRRTFRPGRLKTSGDIQVVCGYDANQLQELYDQVGIRTTVTVTLPNGLKIADYAWLDEIAFNDHNEDDDPEATLTIAIGAQDWDTCEEEDPTIVVGTGTLAEC
jgi:hypothetical protein